MRKTTVSLLAVFLFWVGVVQCFAWDTKVGHPKTTDAATVVSSNLKKFVDEFELSNKEFKIEDPYDTPDKFWNKEYPVDHSFYTGWIRKGSIFEDYGFDHKTSNTKEDNRRFLNHYYDGISHNGLFHLEWVKNTVSFLMLGIFNNTPAITPQPTLPWAKEGVGVDGPNEWSWKKAREYEFNALTAQDTDVRNENFAKMFRSVGQVSHLLEDMAQPGHVRNDAHVSMKDSEAGAWILNSSTHEEWVKNYGCAVDVGVYADKDIIRKNSIDEYFNGLARLINRNFYSDDTIPLRVTPDGEIEQINGAYSRPAIADTDFNAYKFDSDLSIVKYSTPPYDVVLDGDGNVRRTLTITNMATDEIVGQLLFSAGYFEEYRPLLGNVLSSRVAFKLTNNVVKNNAEIVLPMASKYAAGLVDYFFRGAMEMNESTYEIINKSGEAMDGTFTLYYDDAGDKRTQVAGASWTTSIAPNAAFTPENLVLPEAAKSRPDNIKDKYILVFSGTLGSEPNAVAGKAVTLKSGPEGKWEEWNSWTPIPGKVNYWQDNSYNKGYDGYFKTDKHIWYAEAWGKTNYFIGNVDVSDGRLTVEASRAGNNYGYAELQWSRNKDKEYGINDKPIPVGKCSMEIVMPVAVPAHTINCPNSVSYCMDGTGVTLVMYFKDDNGFWYRVDYALSARSDRWNCGIKGPYARPFYYCRAVLNVGENVRRLEDDINWLLTEAYNHYNERNLQPPLSSLTNPDKLYLESVGIYMEPIYYAYTGPVIVEIESIDFTCEE